MWFESRNGRQIDIEKPVRVYRNLNKRMVDVEGGVVYSILQDGLVVGYTDRIVLRDVQFLVNSAGRDWVRRTRKKTVHAYVKGHLALSQLGVDLQQGGEKVSYNPYRNDTFVLTETNEPIYSALIAEVDHTGVKVIR